jgi:hypothetical protein
VALDKARSARRVRGVAVRFAGGKLRLGAIPVEALGEVARALAQVKLPASAD